jgi:deoxycytidylate deaminase
MQLQEPEYLGYYPGAELVFAIVCPLGTPYKRVVEALSNYLGHFRYRTETVQLSAYFGDLLRQFGAGLSSDHHDATERARFKIRAGNKLREISGKNDVMALVAAGAIADRRSELARLLGRKAPQGRNRPVENTAFIVSTVRRPEEVSTLRRIYGEGFFLIGVNSSREDRERYLIEKGLSAVSANELMDIDASEQLEYGQATRNAFQLADVFLSDSQGSTRAEQVSRFLDLLFGCPKITPTAEEHGMFMAYSASLRSGDLSRQVGAAVIDEHGDLISVGFNEAPKIGGGLYGPPTEGRPSYRDVDRGWDSNEREKERLASRIAGEIGGDAHTVRSALKSAGFFDITEFGRSVHAEMEALLACARSGRSARGATIFTTTFPCHTCTRHIIAAGIRNVIYIEPYAKSRASELHPDEITVDQKEGEKIPFLPFVGVGPRRYFDLFSLRLGMGYPVERKRRGELIPWARETAPVRLQMKPSTYLQRELLAYGTLKGIRSAHA